MVPVVVTLLVVLAIGSVTSFKMNETMKFQINRTTPLPPTTMQPAKLNATDDKVVGNQPAKQNATDKMVGDQPAPQQHAPTSDGSQAHRYMMRTLVPGQHYVLTALAAQQALNQRPSQQKIDYYDRRPDFQKPGYPWCGNPYGCSNGGNICLTHECLYGAFCCRTNKGLCCYQSNAAHSQHHKESDKPEGSLSNRLPYVPVNVIKPTAKPVYFYTRPAPRVVHGHNSLTHDAYNPAAAPYDAYKFPSFPNQPNYESRPTRRADFNSSSNGGYPSASIPVLVPGQDNGGNQLGLGGNSTTAVVHPMHGVIQIQSEDDEAEEVLKRITAQDFASPHTGLGQRYSRDHQPDNSPLPPNVLVPDSVQPPTYHQLPHVPEAPVYPASTQGVLGAYTRSLGQQPPVSPYPYRRYPRSHYNQYQPYATLQILHPSQVFHPSEQSYYANVHAKREAPPPYAEVQQVYYPSQVFRPQGAYRSNLQFKRDLPQYSSGLQEVYYPSQVFYPYFDRSRRQSYS